MFIVYNEDRVSFNITAPSKQLVFREKGRNNSQLQLQYLSTTERCQSIWSLDLSGLNVLTFSFIQTFIVENDISGSASPSPYSEADQELYDYVSDEAWAGEQSRQIIPPTFTSTPQTLLVDEGDTVRLPCLVDRLEGFVMLWKKETDIVTVAEQIIDQVRGPGYEQGMKYLYRI